MNKKKWWNVWMAKINKQRNKKWYENEQGFQSLCENCTQDRFSF